MFKIDDRAEFFDQWMVLADQFHLGQLIDEIQAYVEYRLDFFNNRIKSNYLI